MKNPYNTWVFAGIWDTFRIILLFIVLVLNDFLFIGLRPLVYTVLLVPSLTFSLIATLNGIEPKRKTELGYLWKFSKILSICSLVFLIFMVFRGTFVDRGFLHTIYTMQSFLLISLGILLGDLWILGSLLFPYRKDGSEDNLEDE